MKTSCIRVLQYLLLSLVLACVARQACAQEPTERVILFIIDGLAAEAPARINMPRYSQLKKQGIYYQAMHLVLPGHPKKSPEYPWSCSLPNPMLMSGTPFIGTDGIGENLLQHSFDPKETAFIVNAHSYLDVSGGFGTYISKPRNPDSLVIDLTIEAMKKQDFTFMRVHLQQAGIKGMRVSEEKYSDLPDYRNIWHKESRYREAVETADEQLGRFVDWLKAEDLWSGTLLMICGDHGQANEGWHEPYSAESNVTPLLLVGAGVRSATTFKYCEILDVAPTIADVLKKKQPAFSCGRILKEAFNENTEVPNVPQTIKRLNKVLIKANSFPEPRKKRLSDKGLLTLDDLGVWHKTEAKSDFEKFTAQQEAILKAGIDQPE